MTAEITALKAGMAETLAGMDRQIAALDAQAAPPIAQPPNQMMARFFGLAVQLPLVTDFHSPGQIFDADGARVLVIDPAHYPRKSTAAAIAALIVQAVNRGAGLL